MYNERGQSIFEVIVAIGLISLVLITLVSMASLSVAASTFSRNQTQAARFTQQASEWLRAEKDAGWVSFQSHTVNSIWCLDSLTWSKPSGCSNSEVVSGTIFKRVLTFTGNADGSVIATIITTWTDARGNHTTPTSILFGQEGSQVVVSTPAPTALPTPAPTATPTPTPTPSWIFVGFYNVGCGTTTAVSYLARQMRFQMVSGGGGDGIISYGPPYGSSGVSWTTSDSTTYPATGPNAISVGTTLLTTDFGSIKTVTLQTARVGCNDGETMTMAVYRYGY